MPLRKKHVRIALVAVIMVGVLGLVTTLVVYGLHVRGGAFGTALERALAGRLRCDATVRGARPTGLSTAAADTVRLEWTAGGGRLTLDLHTLRATRNPDGVSWTVSAVEGRLALVGDDPAATLAAINQRLVQVDTSIPVNYLYVQRLDLALAMDPLQIETRVRLALFPDGKGLDAYLLDPDLADGPVQSLEADALRPLAQLRVAPTNAGGVFAGLHAEVNHLPARAVRRALGMAVSDAAAVASDTVDLKVDWFWPEADARAGRILLASRDLDLAAWTTGLPGGPVTGAATLDLAYTLGPSGDTSVAFRLDAPGATVDGDTLDWLAGLPGPLAGWGAVCPPRVTVDRFTVRVQADGQTARFLGPRQEDVIPLVGVRLMGYDIPLVWASAAPFEASPLWPAVHAALRAVPDNADREPPTAYAQSHGSRP